MKDKIIELLNQPDVNSTEEAFELLGQMTSDGILLHAQFNGAKRQYMMGMIDFSEWTRIRADIFTRARIMLNEIKE